MASGAYVSEVIPNLFLGNREAAAREDRKVPEGWTYITCTEYRDRGELPLEPTDSIDIRFTAFDDTARPEYLDAIARRIDENLKVDKKVLVHCVMGCERSPLAIVWYLVKAGRFTTIDAAYQHVMARHPPTGDRRHWLKGAVPVPFAIDAKDVLASPTAVVAATAPLLGLCLIVKNEAHGLAATLESFKPFVDSWLVLDTGSTDGTQDIIRKELAGIPGRLVETAFRDFSHARNLALDCFVDTVSEQIGIVPAFVIMPDADDLLHGGGKLREFLETVREADDERDRAYMFNIRRAGNNMSYYLPIVMRTAAGLRYKGRVHECLDYVATKRIEDAFLTHAHHDKSLAATHRRYHRDREWLQQDVYEDPSNARALFYLAQTYKSLADGVSTDETLAPTAAEKATLSKEDLERVVSERWAARAHGFRNGAIEFYEKYLKLSSFFAEQYEARYRIAELKEERGDAWGDVMDAYLTAFEYDPRHAEPLFRIALHYRNRKQWALCYLFALRAAQMRAPATELYNLRDVYQWRAADLVATAGYYLGQQTSDPIVMATGKVFADRCVQVAPSNESFRATRAWFAPPSMLFMGTHLRQIVVDDALAIEPGFGLGNASIHYDGRKWRLLQRTHNYKIVGGKYLTPSGREVGPGDPIHTNNVMLELDHELQPTSVWPMRDLPRDRGELRTAFPVHGYEDCRIAHVDRKRIFASATVCDFSPDGQRQMVLLAIDPITYNVLDAKLMPVWPEHADRHQKNWMPWIPAGKVWEARTIDFVYGTAPLSTITSSGPASDSDCPHEVGRLRGGSQVIPLENRYDGRFPKNVHLCLVHDVAFPGEGHRIYLHRFVLFAEGKVRAMTEPFFFKKLGIEFCAGLAFGPVGTERHDKLVASFSVDDSESYLAIFDPASVFGALLDKYIV